MYILQTARKGISSYQLSKEIGIRQSSAWFLLHRLRKASGAKRDSLLTGVVEVDETYIGGLEKNKHERKRFYQGRGAVGKQTVFDMRQRGGEVIAFPIGQTTKQALQDAMQKHISSDSTVYTDDHRSYIGVEKHFAQHRAVTHSAAEYVNGQAHTNGMEAF